VGTGVGCEGATGKNLSPRPVGICGGKGIATSALEHTAQILIDPLLAIARIGSEQQEIVSEVSGTGHRRFEKRQVPQRWRCFKYPRHRAGQVSTRTLIELGCRA
jgi:hypothetical protein